jgi:hypothetical protein
MSCDNRCTGDDIFPAPCSTCAGRDSKTHDAEQSASNAVLTDIANCVSGHLPEGWELSLCIENGSACISLKDNKGRWPSLPDSSDKTLMEQINDAVCVANGFI